MLISDKYACATLMMNVSGICVIAIVATIAINSSVDAFSCTIAQCNYSLEDDNMWNKNPHKHDSPTYLIVRVIDLKVWRNLLWYYSSDLSANCQMRTSDTYMNDNV